MARRIFEKLDSVEEVGLSERGCILCVRMQTVSSSHSITSLLIISYFFHLSFQVVTKIIVHAVALLDCARYMNTRVLRGRNGSPHFPQTTTCKFPLPIIVVLSARVRFRCSLFMVDRTSNELYARVFDADGDLRSDPRMCYIYI